MQLAQFMADRGLDDEQFAQMVGGVDRSLVNRWRRRKTVPDRENIRKIAEATGELVTANDFYAPADSLWSSGEGTADFDVSEVAKIGSVV